MQDQLCADAHTHQHIDRQRIDVERRQDGKNPLVPFVEELRLRMGRLNILRGRGRKVGVGEHRAFWKPGRATGVLKYSY